MNTQALNRANVQSSRARKGWHKYTIQPVNHLNTVTQIMSDSLLKLRYTLTFLTLALFLVLFYEISWNFSRTSKNLSSQTINIGMIATKFHCVICKGRFTEGDWILKSRIYVYTCLLLLWIIWKFQTWTRNYKYKYWGWFNTVVLVVMPMSTCWYQWCYSHVKLEKQSSKSCL